jgi:L-seryl-tRNA(Ser) seleniumtransferase
LNKDADSDRPPQLGILLARPEVAAWIPRISRPLVARAAAACIHEHRLAFLAAGAGSAAGATGADLLETLVEKTQAACAAIERRRILPVLNATGVLLHTNLGRSPLGVEAWEAARAANEGYSSLEIDLATGSRGIRGDLVRALAAELAGAEAALVVNNNAAALLLALGSLCAGREVLISRGEELQIGGGFRIPDILALSGARLVEVGTTNVTSLEDYEAALGPDTAAILVVHRANFAMRGFVESPRLSELASILPSGVILIVDQGSGCHSQGIPGETPLVQAIRDGADLVCFSADKLLGGPQAGLAAGRAGLVERMACHPLARALRPGKTVLSLLEDRLVRVLNGEPGRARLPEADELEAFGRRVLRKLPAGLAKLVASTCALGGGSSPDEVFPSYALEIEEEAAAAVGGPASLLARLREGETPVIALLREGRVRLDLAALEGTEASLLASLLAASLGVEAKTRGGERAAHPRPTSPAPLPEIGAGAEVEAEEPRAKARRGEGLFVKALRFEASRPRSPQGGGKTSGSAPDGS